MFLPFPVESWVVTHDRAHNCKGGGVCATVFACGCEIRKPEYMNNFVHVCTFDKKGIFCEKER